MALSVAVLVRVMYIHIYTASIPINKYIHIHIYRPPPTPRRFQTQQPKTQPKQHQVGDARAWAPELVSKAQGLKVGSGMEAGTDVGPLISKARRLTCV